MRKKRFLKKHILRGLLCPIAMICLCPLTAFAQHSVSGVVSDGNGSVQGVNVFVKGTTRGVMSDAAGKYEIAVSGNSDVLVFSFVGYTQQEITVGNRQVIDVTLIEEAEDLDEVVVVGYGTQKKVSLTGSVATVSPKDIRNIPVSNLSNALAGRLTGVTIRQGSGGRPGNAADVVIRARGTWNSTSPLYVIDGVAKGATEFNMLSANDVESISVLKDASTSAIYGSRAANGVILVTTKRGQMGRPVINYSGSVNVSTDFAVLPQRETAAQRIAWVNDRAREAAINPNSDLIPYNSDGYRYWPTIYKEDGSTLISTEVFTPDEEEFYRNRGDYDLLKEAWNTPITTTHALSVSGGTEKVRYFISGNYYDETGVFETLKYKKFSVRGNIDADIVHGLKAGLSINLNNSENSGPPGLGRNIETLFYRIMVASPLIPAKVDGKYVHNITEANFAFGVNPLAVIEGATGKEQHTYRNNDYTASLQWSVPWVKGLNLRTTFNQSFNSSFYKAWSTPYTTYDLKLEGTNNHIVTDEFVDGAATVLGGQPRLVEEHGHALPHPDNKRPPDMAYQWNGFVSYDNTFGKHDLSLLLGFEQSENFGEWFSASMSNYELNKPYFMFGPTTKNEYFGINGGAWEDARLSYLGHLKYTFDNRYILELSFRRDASVKFAPDHRWGFFPSVSGAWRVSEESFFKNNVKFINQLKLRASYGMTGNDDVNAWQWLDSASPSAPGMYYGGETLTGGVAMGPASNPNITWEKSRNLDLGVDMGFLDNMITLGGGYFFRHTYDILGDRTADLPDTFGSALPSSNYGVVNSFGIEVEIGFNKQLTKDIGVWAKGNFGWADNKLVEWAESGVPSHLSRIGKNWDRTYGFVSDGVIWDMTPNGDDTYNITTSTGGKYVVHKDYAAARGNNGIEAQYAEAMRPGFVFIKDIGSQSVDESGATVYSSEPEGRLTDGFADKAWIVDHINPPYNYGLLLGGNWKGLSLEVFLQGTAGNMIGINHPYDITDQWFGGSFGHWSANHFSYVNNPRAEYPMPSNFLGYYTIGDNSQNAHSFWMRDASFVRLKTVSLSYEFDKKLVAKIGLGSARIHLTGNNLALLYNPLKEFDPEVTVDTKLSGFEGVYSTAIGVYPLLRSFTLGIDIGF